MTFDIPAKAVGLRLARFVRGDDLILCEPVRFARERAAVELTLRRAAISGLVEIEGEIINHFADILDDNCDIVGTVALDADSYGALKNRWMRCKVERTDDEN